MDETSHLTNTPFSDLDLEPPLLQGLNEAGFTHCTEIQAKTLPLLLKGQDIAGQAQTGTGKTATFLLALYSHLMRSETENQGRVRAVVLAPTRELAIQIHKDAELLGKFTEFRLGIAYGGTGYRSQRDTIAAGVDILIGTPGRIIDYYKQGVFTLDAVEVVVFDEADRMFDLGFLKDMRYLLRRMPPATERLNLLFSATLSLRVSELAYEHMDDPTVVKIDASSPVAERLTEGVYYPAKDEKLALLTGLLKTSDADRVLVFVNTRHMSEKVGRVLRRQQYAVGVLSGDVPQVKREKLLARFKSGDIRILVATDVAARGLHIPSVGCVVNFDLPQDAEDYVHRIGRTARAGQSGVAISFACEEYAYSLMDIEAFIGHKIEKLELTAELTRESSPAAPQKTREKKDNRASDKKGKAVSEKPKDSSEAPKAARKEAPPNDPTPVDEGDKAATPANRKPGVNSAWLRRDIDIPAIG